MWVFFFFVRVQILLPGLSNVQVEALACAANCLSARSLSAIKRQIASYCVGLCAGVSVWQLKSAGSHFAGGALTAHGLIFKVLMVCKIIQCIMFFEKKKKNTKQKTNQWKLDNCGLPVHIWMPLWSKQTNGCCLWWLHFCICAFDSSAGKNRSTCFFFFSDEALWFVRQSKFLLEVHHVVTVRLEWGGDVQETSHAQFS